MEAIANKFKIYEREYEDMKNKKIFLGMVCAIVLGLTACADGENDVSGVQALQPKMISTETSFPDVQGTEMQGTEDHGTGTQSTESHGTETWQSGTRELQQQAQNDTDEDLDERLARYRAEREGMTNVAMGNGVSGYGAPNAENYGFQTDMAEYMQNFDSRELNKAYETAKKYVVETLAISVETNAVVYSCVDPRITEIYEAEDKGVADGYDSGNIFVCEYCDSGMWQYLILVRNGKGSDWNVIHHGGSYKE